MFSVSIVIHDMEGENISTWDNGEGGVEDAFQVIFKIAGRLDDRRAFIRTRNAIRNNLINWVTPATGKWILDLTRLRQAGTLNAAGRQLDWLEGDVLVEPEIEQVHRDHFGTLIYDTEVRLTVYKEDFMANRSTQVFLSHSGADKDMVRRFEKTLTTMGFEPWLDENAMPLGSEINRSILSGFQRSCAAVFFVTPNFKEDRFLRTEIDYAITQKREKGDRFGILTLVFRNADGVLGEVPQLLHSYRWVVPSSELDALCEIIKGLPIIVGPPSWKLGL